MSHDTRHLLVDAPGARCRRASPGGVEQRDAAGEAVSARRGEGFYRATRFDWSGMIETVEYGGHKFYGRWFQGTDPAVKDFEYRGAEITRGPYCRDRSGRRVQHQKQGPRLRRSEAGRDVSEDRGRRPAAS